MKKLWANEPTLIVGFFQAVLALAVTFGAKLTAEQIGAILAALAALLAIFVRSQVSPASKVKSSAPSGANDAGSEGGAS